MYCDSSYGESQEQPPHLALEFGIDTTTRAGNAHTHCPNPSFRLKYLNIKYTFPHAPVQRIATMAVDGLLLNGVQQRNILKTPDGV